MGYGGDMELKMQMFVICLVLNKEFYHIKYTCIIDLLWIVRLVVIIRN